MFVALVCYLDPHPLALCPSIPPYYSTYSTILYILYILYLRFYCPDRGIYPRPSNLCGMQNVAGSAYILLLVTPSHAARGGHVMVSRSSGPETVSRALKRLQMVHVLESFLRSSHLSLSSNKRSLKIAPVFPVQIVDEIPLRLISFRLLGVLLVAFCCHSPPCTV